MALLCVRVKKAKLHGPPDKFNSYMTLKVQNVKSSTVTVRGQQPCWEQDFMFEVSQKNCGLVLELWNKGLIWDTMLGTTFIPWTLWLSRTRKGLGVAQSGLRDSDEGGPGLWDVQANLSPSALDMRFELPFEIPDDEAQYWTRKLQRLNTIAAREEYEELRRKRMASLPSQCCSWTYFGWSTQKPYDDQDSAINDGDSDCRSEPGGRPALSDWTHRAHTGHRDGRLPRRSHSKAASSMVPVDSGMGVDDWEAQYKVPDCDVLDDYLDHEQKMWEDEDKNVIYRIIDSHSESKGSRFYQTVEYDKLSLGRENEPGSRSVSADIRLVYKQAGSFEDETSPPEIDIIPSVRKQRQQMNTETLLYQTRQWAKSGFESTLDSYTAFCEEEAAWSRTRADFNSMGSDEMQYSCGSVEDLDDLMFYEGDNSYDYEHYYYPERPWSSAQNNYFSHHEEMLDHEPDPMDELRSLPMRRKLPELPKDPQVCDQSNKSKPDTKEESGEQTMSGVKQAMSSLFSSITSSKPSTAVSEASTAAASTEAQPVSSGLSKLLSFIPKQTADSTDTSSAADPPPATSAESGISKLLSFIPKSGGSGPPVAIVPPAAQESTAEKKFSLQSLLPFQSSEPGHQTASDASPAVVIAPQDNPPASTQSTSVVDSVLGRLSPMRFFSSPSPSREPSPQQSDQRSNSAAGSVSLSLEESVSGDQQLSRPGSEVGSTDLRDTRSGSIELRQDSGSGSVELLPETESSGDLPDIQQRRTPAPPDQPADTSATDSGFFSSFKSLSTLLSTSPSDISAKTENRPVEAKADTVSPSDSPPKPPTPTPSVKPISPAGTSVNQMDAASKVHQPLPNVTVTEFPERVEEVKTAEQMKESTEPPSQGILGGLLKLGSAMGSTEDLSKAPTGSQPQQGGLFSGLFSSSASQSSAQTQPSQTSPQPTGLLSGLFKAASDSVVSSVTQPVTPSAESQSSEIPKPQAQDQALPQPAGLLSGLFKKATDAVSGEQTVVSTHQHGAADSSVKPETMIQSNVPSLKVSPQSKNVQSESVSTHSPHSNQRVGPQAMQAGQQSSHVTPKTQPKPSAAATQPQSGFFDSLFKSSPAPSQSAPPNQHSQESGNMLTGLFNKIVEPSVSTQPPQQVRAGGQDPNQKTAPPAQPQEQPQQKGFFSGLFGLQDTPTPAPAPAQAQTQSGPQESARRPNLQQPNQASHQSANSSGGLLGGLFNKSASDQQQKSSDKVSQVDFSLGFCHLAPHRNHPPIVLRLNSKPRQATGSPCADKTTFLLLRQLLHHQNHHPGGCCRGF
ncbi:hypothetical protein WMY93_012935 [Mugilogobius chulae]|uniref:C2 domain-containing protein n=1 Tax=Mugilogobius chulae TaxID=88201 RepID=A0AAW0P218_9GOBI